VLSVGFSHLVDLWLNAAKGQQEFMRWVDLALTEGILQQFSLNTMEEIFLHLTI